MISPQLPASTYRLQLTAQFTFDDAAQLCPYLHRLGVGWVYLSPILQAQPGSKHGYDVIDHSRIDAERGGADGFARFSAAAHREGLGVLVDLVPNHMGVATPALNSWWWEVLRLGRASRYAVAFDVDWAAGNGRIRLPVLGDGPHELDALRIDGDELGYYESRYPIAPGTRRHNDSPRDVHERQNYELVNWRRADSELNYRRFFAINSLAGIRVEEQWVFDESHAQVVSWFREGMADGVRVDHPDGLADPRGYLEKLAEATGGAPVWVEKILEGDEALPREWLTCGTTGYDALGDIDRVLVDARGRDGLERAQRSIGTTTRPELWADLIFDSKSDTANGILRSEVHRLARLMPEIPDAASALVALIAAFPVYRSYLPLGREYLEEARFTARFRVPQRATTIDAVTVILSDPIHPAAIRFQQTSGMIMAKGVEDSAFYRYNTLTSLNEVGADPSEFAIDVGTFHERQARRQRDWPHSMTTMTTHDTKRGEDVRARISALAEQPSLWAQALNVLHNSTELHDPDFENLLWQAVIGSWPATRERLHGYAEKAAREAGTSTNWIAPDADVERRIHECIDAAFDNPAVTAVIESVVSAVASSGYINGLSAKLLQLAAPGIPDVYQGSEIWEMSLVDPDNRRPVDFSKRVVLLDQIDAGWVPSLDAIGAAKLRVTSRALRLRRDHSDLFTTYRPISASGSAREHVVAFDRGGAIAIVTRLPHGLALGGGWNDTTIDLPEACVDVITGTRFSGRNIPVADLFGTYPVALVTGDST
ncbi:MAG: malto-oligosyltrehalose synthase [Terrimesophilobacter sp.]